MEKIETHDTDPAASGMYQTGQTMAAETALGTGASGLALPAARWTIVVAWFCVVASGAFAGTLSFSDPLLPFAHALALLGVFVLTDPHDAPLSGFRALSVPLLSVSVTAIVLVSVPDGSSPWLINFAGYLTALQLARGNTLIGLSGSGLQILLVCGWAFVTSAPIDRALQIITLPAAALVLAFIWRGVLRKIVAREREHRSSMAIAMRAEDAAAAASIRFQSELESIGAQVRPILQQLESSATITKELAAEISVVEASIRDRIRAPRLQHPRVSDAALRARHRGVKIAMLTDSADPQCIGEIAAAQLQEILDGVRAPAEIVLSCNLREPTEVHAVIRSESEHARFSVQDPR